MFVFAFSIEIILKQVNSKPLTPHTHTFTFCCLSRDRYDLHGEGHVTDGDVSFYGGRLVPNLFCFLVLTLFSLIILTVKSEFYQSEFFCIL